MSVTLEDVHYIAKLARLELTQDEAIQTQEDLNKILSYMDELNQVDTSGVEPLEHVFDFETRLRPDTPESPVPHDDALRDAPDADSDYIRVPKVIE
ncbi:MAG: Asp-tRNA(Asn)/Glu-tRNA(Gln) amidotransferase subunit GatC [Balneolaceae bacterium]|jgi:aspartyl-tRNA(Asn)/glutamyl-tRNA(Gln) amidotransferase subunit C|nr:Asp-tRNA(Asn)/Glu-tRNA(Gln) amidotransferase subunit GatC [Balneolaceae bacterium]MDR9446531.1 Asp-tRNA(Asn)/Glu-tRNA(Gln) amidotransferase subunit GatC [Balneolaceae bacterium]